MASPDGLGTSLASVHAVIRLVYPGQKEKESLTSTVALRISGVTAGAEAPVTGSVEFLTVASFAPVGTASCSFSSETPTVVWSVLSTDRGL